jgi:glutaredoxin
MKKITLYSTTYCPYCFRAKELLKNLALEYTEIDVTNDSELRDRLTENEEKKENPFLIENQGEQNIKNYQIGQNRQEEKYLISCQ